MNRQMMREQERDSAPILRREKEAEAKQRTRMIHRMLHDKKKPEDSVGFFCSH